MEFWSKLNAALKQNGFSAAQIKKLQEAFGHLDAAELLRLPTVQLLPVVKIEPIDLNHDRPDITH